MGGGAGSACGTLYTVEDATHAALDRLEGHPSYHRRASIMLADGSSAQAYLLPTGHVDGRPTIDSGGWRPYRSVAVWYLWRAVERAQRRRVQPKVT
jgi:gamma-glutamylcyclotransferase (GGCT)/AIG2-like uncharacterized protein YtfP